MIRHGTDVLVRYQRGKQFAKGAALMADSTAYCPKAPTNAVVKPIRSRKAATPGDKT
jgi:hypothetical protein